VSSDVFDAIRSASARVMERARSVRIDDAALAALAEELLQSPEPSAEFDPGHHRVDGPESTLAFVVTLNAINFGSGYFPFLAKRSGLSGYLTIATTLKERFATVGPWRADELMAIDAADCAALFGQDLAVPEVAELMGLFATALADLGRFVDARHGGRFAGITEVADGSAAALVGELADMPFYRDVVLYDGFEVPFYKRAQITAADLFVAFEGRGYGCFRDIDRLTIFADNLVPHVLRRKGVLVYSDELLRRIEAGEPIRCGEPEEVEIRAGAVHAVERCVARLRERGASVTAQQLDFRLWTSGHSPEMKAHPRHRTRTTYY